MDPYRIQLQEFEGPLDLLLFFIRRDELDVYDIPIARIADEFLSTVRLMEEVDLDGVADFIYMAALLINIKARMLLPRPEVDDDGEPIDPRRELVERLLEYMRFKEAAEHLADEREARADLFTRGLASAQAERHDDEEPAEIVDTSVFDLISALRSILAEAPEEPVHAVERIEYSVEEQRDYLLEQLAVGETASFAALVREQPKGYVIATFLAALELARIGHLWLLATGSALDFDVKRIDPEAEAVPSNGSNGTMRVQGTE